MYQRGKLLVDLPGTAITSLYPMVAAQSISTQRPLYFSRRK